MDNKSLWMHEQGFSKDGKIYCVAGGNTFLIKDVLKDYGFQYSPRFGWYCREEKQVPAPYYLVSFTFDELFLWEPQYQRAFPYSDIDQKIKNKLYINKENKNNFDFIGTVGEREYDLLVIFKKYKIIKKEHYKYYVYSFDYKGNRIIWSTKKWLNLSVGQEILLTGTVSAHSLVGNTKITKMNRCIITS